MVRRVLCGAGIVVLASMAVGCSLLPRSYVVVMPNPDGSVGTVIVRGARGQRTVDEASKATGFNARRRQVNLEYKQVERTFWQVLTGAPPDPVRFVLYFDKGEIVPNRNSTETWDTLLTTVRHWPAPEVEIQGHADRKAADEFNRELSNARAERIRVSVLRAGADPERVRVLSYGEALPAVPTQDEVSEPLNRRVEIAVR